MRRLAAVSALCCVLLCLGGRKPARADHVVLRAAGPVGLGYVGLLYGLVDPADGSWYLGADLFGSPSRAWVAIGDTGASASILGMTTQESYAAWDGVGIPLEDYPEVKFTDVGFGGTVDFAVTKPVDVMMADFKTAFESGDPENPGLYGLYGPYTGPASPATRMAAALEPIGGGVLGIDFDIIGMTNMQGRVLHVDPHYLEMLRLSLFVMAGSLQRPLPPPTDPRALYVPVTLEPFFEDPQAVDVGEHPMLPIHIRRAASDPFATATAIFDTGSPANFVSESFAVAAGIDVESTPEMTLPITGVGGTQTEAPGWFVDALALDLGHGREGDQLAIGNTAVFIIPDEAMPGDLDAILGNSMFSPSMWMEDTPVVEWYVDMRYSQDAAIIVVLPATPGDANFDGAVDGGDYTIWADHYLQPGCWGEGDFNEDGFIDGGDYTIWSDNYVGGGSAVPEPAAVTLLALAAAALLRRRGRGARRRA